MAEASEKPIIIKKIKKGGHGGHHGGAWKVAYADFVTAMMAFFLLLWLLSVTSPEQKMGLAEYFTPTIGVKDSMGIGFKGGKSPDTTVGRSNSDLTAPGIVTGQVKQGEIAGAPTPELVKESKDAEATAAEKSGNEPVTKVEPGQNVVRDDQEDTLDKETFKDASEDVRQALEINPDMKEYKNNIIVQDTPEGLKIDMIDDPQKPMFIPGGAVITDMGKKVLDSMANIIAKTPNNISLNGHTDAASATANPAYTSWELSADRANAARRFLITTQLEPQRVVKVIGLADRELLTPQEPANPRNRRVTIVLLRGSYFRDPKAMPTVRTLLSVPNAKVKKAEPKKEDKKDDEEAEPERSGPSIFDPLPLNR